MQRPCLSLQLFSELQCLTDCRQKVCEELGLQEDAVELSMGMSNDFEEAVSGLAAARTMQVLWRETQKGQGNYIISFALAVCDFQQ